MKDDNFFSVININIFVNKSKKKYSEISFCKKKTFSAFTKECAPPVRAISTFNKFSSVSYCFSALAGSVGCNQYWTKEFSSPSVLLRLAQTPPLVSETRRAGELWFKTITQDMYHLSRGDT